MYYAQINTEGIVHTVSHLAGVVVAENMIPVESMDTGLLGKRYNAQTQEFEAVVPIE